MGKKGHRKGDLEFITGLASGLTVKDAAARAGIGQTTAQRRLKDHRFRERVASARDELFRLAVGKLANAATEAVETLRSLLNSDSPSAQLGAARAILEHGPKLREQSELEARISALEATHNAE